MIMKKQRTQAKRNKKYRPRAFNAFGKEIIPRSPLWKRIARVVLMVIAGILLVLAVISKVMHFFNRHWQQ